MNGTVSCVRVQQDEQRVADDRLAAFVDLFDRAARQQHAEAADEVGVPRLVGHLAAVGREPRDVLAAADAAALEILPTAQRRLRQAEVHQLARELEERCWSSVEVPVDPGDLVVLAVRVVVARAACVRARRRG